ncbi:MAG: hypothetical protein JWN61_368 [Pseudonocardiales bacterium]|nr:hypothetical protein [Pseudonocardiales bacterium]
MAKEPPDTLLLVRRLDGLIYRFEREPQEWNRRPSYRRSDLPLWIRWTDADGWVVLDEAGTPNGWPLSDARDSPQPPQTGWRSHKGAKSYLYDLRSAEASRVPIASYVNPL